MCPILYKAFIGSGYLTLFEKTDQKDYSKKFENTGLLFLDLDPVHLYYIVRLCILGLVLFKSPPFAVIKA